MAQNPTQLVTEHLTRDAAILREAQRRLTMADEPMDVLGRVARAVRRPDARGYGAIHNARVVSTSVHLGALRRALVQWAAQHAPAEVGGFRALLDWALARVDWPEVVRGVTLAAGGCAAADIRTFHFVGLGRRAHTALGSVVR